MIEDVDEGPRDRRDRQEPEQAPVGERRALPDHLQLVVPALHHDLLPRSRGPRRGAGPARRPARLRRPRRPPGVARTSQHREHDREGDTEAEDPLPQPLGRRVAEGGAAPRRPDEADQQGGERAHPHPVVGHPQDQERAVQEARADPHEERRPPEIVGVDTERLGLVGIQRRDPQRRQEADRGAEDEQRGQPARPLRLEALDVEPQAGRDRDPEDERGQAAPMAARHRRVELGAEDGLPEVEQDEEHRAQAREEQGERAESPHEGRRPLPDQAPGALHEQQDRREDDASGHRAHGHLPLLP